jgi:hypothetical protein
MKYLWKEVILLASLLLFGPATCGSAWAATILGPVSFGVILVDFKDTPEKREAREKAYKLEQEEAERKWDELTPAGKK